MSELNPDIGSSVSYVVVDAEYAGQRVDNFLSARLGGVPRSHVYRLLRRGEVRVNKGRVKPHYRLKAGDQLRIPPVSLAPKTEQRLPERLLKTLSNAVLYESDEWLVVNKPAGLAVHGGSGLSFGLIEGLRQLRPDCRNLELCHRLDKPTSGCLVLAKKRSALKRFHQALREKRIDKRYYAFVNGRWSDAVRSVNVPLEKNVLSSGERMVRASVDGKPSQTKYRIVERYQGFTLLEAMPVTGRTHQIRVHCKEAGHPIVGDEKYGVREIDQQFRSNGFAHLFLHAHSITLPLDGGEKNVSCGMPDSWVECFSQLGVTVAHGKG